MRRKSPALQAVYRRFSPAPGVQGHPWMGRLLLGILLFVLMCGLCAGALAESVSRALLIGVDDFVSMPSTGSASAENVRMMKDLLLSDEVPPREVTVPDEPLFSWEQLRLWVEKAFGEASDEDVNLFYLSTHCVYQPEEGVEAALLLSDGMTETRVTPQALREAFEGIRGTQVLILDACYSGAFIGKGLTELPKELPLSHPGWLVLTSCSAREESWIYSSGAQSGFYFTSTLAHCVGAESDHCADVNRDGEITWSELYSTLLRHHAASTPQVYPAASDFVLYRYNPESPASETLSPLQDVLFSDTMLSLAQHSIDVEFTVLRPSIVAYQVVYYQQGRWQFDRARLIYDQAETYQVNGESRGAVSPGQKARRVLLSSREEDNSGYALVQVMTLSGDVWQVQSGRVLCISSDQDEVEAAVHVSGRADPASGEELCVFVSHGAPCELSVAVVDQENAVVARLCHRQTTRPIGIDGSVFYWNGRTKSGAFADPGEYRVRVQLQGSAFSTTLYSEETFRVE